MNEGYDTSLMPGWKDGSVGYHTDGDIIDANGLVQNAGISQRRPMAKLVDQVI